MTIDRVVRGSQPLVSVIIPVYNYGRFIGETLKSLQSQTYLHWEAIVVDDGSTDDTPVVVACFAGHDSRIKYIRQENQGQPAALNTGLRMYEGEYLQILDADDLIEEKKLERQVAFMEDHREIDLIYGSVRYFSAENISQRLYSMNEGDKPWMPEVSGVGTEVLRTLVSMNIMVVNAPLVRRETAEVIGLFDETLSPLQDWDYWLRYAVQGKRFHYENFEGTLALVRLHAASSSRNKTQMLRASVRMRKKWERMIDDADIRSLNRELLVADAWQLGVAEVGRGSLLGGMSSLLGAGIIEQRLSNKMKIFACALVSPFVSRRRFQKIASTSITKSLLGRWRRA